MKSATSTSGTEQKADTSAQDAIDAKLAKLAAEEAAKLAKQIAQEKEIKAELSAYSDAFNAFVGAARKIGPIGIERLAIAVGESVGKVGRPSQTAFTAFATVLINWRDKDGNRMGFKQRNRLYEVAQKAVGSRKGDEGYWSYSNDEELKKARAAFVKSNGKAGDDQASVRLRMARPATEEIALGE